MTSSPEATATLTYVSISGLSHSGTPDAEVFMATIVPGTFNLDRVGGDVPASCDFEFATRNALQVQTALSETSVAFTIDSMGDGRARARFQTYTHVRGVLNWLKLTFGGATFTNPRYWLSLERGRNTVPALYIDDLDGVGADLEVRQHRIPEEDRPEILPYSQDVWQTFATSLIESGLFQEDGVRLHLDEDSTYYLELIPGPVAASVEREEFVVTIAKMFPPQPPRRTRRRLPDGRR